MSRRCRSYFQRRSRRSQNRFANPVQAMIDKIFIRPLLAVGTFIKRNPLLSLLLLLILFLLPPLLYALSRVFYWIVGIIARLLGLGAAAKVGEWLGRLLTWMQNHQYGCPVFALLIGFVSPLTGGLLTAWCIVDKFKKGPEITTLPASLPDPPTTEGEPETDPRTLGGTNPIDDYFGGQWA